jgi:hypothetical protein
MIEFTVWGIPVADVYRRLMLQYGQPRIYTALDEMAEAILLSYRETFDGTCPGCGDTLGEQSYEGAGCDSCVEGGIIQARGTAVPHDFGPLFERHGIRPLEEIPTGRRDPEEIDS